MTTFPLTDHAGPVPIRHQYYAGIDIGYKNHTVAAIPVEAFGGRKPDTWQRAPVCKFSSDASGFEDLQRYLDKRSVDPNDFLVVREPTGGNYGLSLLFYLLGKSYKVVQVDNSAVGKYQELLAKETKTDPVDARTMARMGFIHEVIGQEFRIREVRQATEAQVALRILVTDSIRVQADVVRRRNQLQQVAAVGFPELQTFFKHSPTSATACAILAAFATPADIVSAGTEQVRRVLLEARAYTLAHHSDDLVALAKATIGVPLSERMRLRQTWLLEQIGTLEAQREQLLAQMEQASASHPYRPLIESLPVRSPIWTASLIAAIGDIAHFETPNEFRAYMGWFPMLDHSGKSANGTKLANRGVRLARRALGQMVFVLLTPRTADNPFRIYHQRLVARGMKPLKAVGHDAAKLATVLYYMLKTDRPYDEARHRRRMKLPQAQAAVVRPLDVPLEVLDAQVIEEQRHGYASDEIPQDEGAPL